MIVNFICRTNSTANYLEIKRRTYLAGAYINRDSTDYVLGGVFEGILEITAYSGSLYREIERSNLSEIGLDIIGGSKEIEDLKK